MDNYTRKVVAVHAKTFETGKFFSICPIDNICRALGYDKSSDPYYARLRMLHCMNWDQIKQGDLWNDMLNDLVGLIAAASDRKYGDGPIGVFIFGGRLV